MNRTFVASLISVTLASGAAMAADLPPPTLAYKEPPPSPVYNWTGCYLGGGGGYGMWNQDGPTLTNGGRGWFGQGQGGCDYQFSLPLSFWSPNVVIGAFGDYEAGNLRGTVTTPVGLSGAESMNNAWAVGGRAGVLVTPKFLTYFDGGYTQANFGQVNFGPGVSIAANTYNGWFLGSGFEYSFGFLPGLFLKTEYRFSSYSTANLPIIGTGVGLNSTNYIQMVSTELVWRFNWFGH
jgi:outer membrane immunogenic protein